MDTVTHALAGAAVGYAGFRYREPGGRLALWTCIVAAEFPDLDIVMLSFGQEAYLRWHRSFTHSALLWPLWAAIVAGIFWAFARRSQYRGLFQAALAGIGVHLFLDWATSYGTELLWPLSDARFALGWVFILDPYVWALLGVTIWAAIRYRSGRAALWGLAVTAGYFVLCGVTATYAQLSAAGPGKVAAYPLPLNPFQHVVVRAQTNATGGTPVQQEVQWIHAGENHTFVSYQDDRLVPQAEATEVVKLFRWFAAFPVVERIETAEHTILRYRDLRFRSVLPGGKVREGLFIIAKVYFDKTGRLVGAGLSSEEE